MNTTEFFDGLRERKWILYVPERVYRAHHDGLLHGWGVSETGRYPLERLTTLLELLKEQNVDLKIPLKKNELQQYEGKIIQKDFLNWVAMYEETDYPSLPKPVLASDVSWDMLVSRLGLVKSLTNRTLIWNNWVYRVRFFSIWVDMSKQALSWRQLYDLAPAQRPEWYRERKRVRAERRVLREGYGLNGKYFGHNYTRRAVLGILKRAYSPEQVKRVRRQLEEKLRKDPAKVISIALEQGLLK